MGTPHWGRRVSRALPLVFLLVVLALLASLLLILSPAQPPAQAFTRTFFSPHTYTQTRAAPQTFTATFEGPDDDDDGSPLAILHLDNGKADGTARVRLGRLLLNGTEVVAPWELGPDVLLVDKPVLLQEKNTLTLTLSGPVGGRVTVSIATRAPKLTSVSPPTGTQGTTLPVAVVGSQTHFAAGRTTLWAGPGVSVGGAPAGTFGPVTVQNATHLTATLTLTPTAPLGPRTLLAKTTEDDDDDDDDDDDEDDDDDDAELASLSPGLTVLPATAALPGTTVTTLAGSGTPGLTDGPGSTAQFAFPADVAVTGSGTVSVADTGNHRLREITPGGTVSTPALPVSLKAPEGLTLDGAGRRILVDTGRCVIRILQADGTVTTIGRPGTCGFANGGPTTARFKAPRDVVADAAGNLYVVDTGNFRVRKINPQGNVTTVAGSGAFGTTDGPAAAATFGWLGGIAVGPDGTLFVSDAVFHTLRRIAPDGTVSTVAGTGGAGFADGPAATAQFFSPTALHRDQAGNLDVTDTGNSLIRRLTPGGQVITLAGTGRLGSTDGSGPSASFHLPRGLSGDSQGKLVVADTFNHKVRVVQVAPIVTAIAPPSAPHGTAVSPFTVTGSNLLGANSVDFRLGDGTPDTAITASNLTVDATGTTLTATVTIVATAALSPRTVTVTTPGGTSDATPSPANTFTVLGQISLIPTFQTLAVGAQGGLTVSLSAAAPTGGLLVTLTSANPAIAKVGIPGGLPSEFVTVTIPAGQSTGPATVTAVSEGSTTLTASAMGFADGLAAVTVISPSLTITRFTPTSGKVGTTVVLTGSGFRPTASQNTVTFAGASGTRVPAVVSAATPTSLTVTVPTGAVTGALQVTTNPSGTATSRGHFVVLPSQDFTLTASPASAQAVPGSSVAVALQALPRDGFTGLVTLSVSGLPAGATAAFSPPALGPSQRGTLSIATGSAGSGTSTLTVTGTATINGAPVSHSADVSLTILAAGQTSLVGRILDTQEQPVPGVTIRLGSLTTTTDAAGNFSLLNPPTGSQIVFLDGSTASTPDRSYPTIPVTVTIIGGQGNTLPFQPHFHAQKARNFTDISNSAAPRTLTDPEVPGFALTVPAGVTITGWDGQPNTQISVQPIPRDRLPLPPPPSGGTFTSVYMFYFGKTGGGTPSAPIPLTVPNDVGALPGETLDLFYFDDSTPTEAKTNAWQLGGTGTVTPDGKQIVTVSGGIQQFCCGGAGFRRPPLPPEAPPEDLAPPRPPAGGGGGGGDPVDLSTGLFILEKTDLVLPGRVPISVTRTYRTLDASAGPFGPGTSHPYQIFLRPEGTDLLVLFLPGNSRSLWSREPDGTFRNDQVPAYRAASITPNPDGSRTLRWKDGSTWGFDPDGRLISQADRNGNTLTISRDSQGRALVLTEPAGRRLTLTYDGSSLRVSSITDPLGRTVQYAYDGGGRLTRVTDPAGGVTEYTYDASNRLRTITDPRTITFLTNEYDAAGRVVRQTQADGGVWTFAYTVTGGLISQAVVTDPRGNPTTHRFNTQGFLISQTDAQGQTTTFERAFGTNLLLSTTDPLGRITRFTYDAQGNVTSITDPAENVRTFTYDPTFNKVTSITDPLGNLTTFEYNARGNLTRTTDPLGAITQVAYNPFGQPVSATDPLGNVTQFEYSARGDLVVTTDPLGNRTTREYDLVSRLITQTDPRGLPTQFAYDGLNRLTQTIDARNGATAFTYDPNGNLHTVTDARGNTISHEYDPMDRLATRTDPLGRAETYGYDGVGNLVSATDRKGQTSTFEYDPLNRRTRATYADGAIATSTYDAGGRLLLADDTADPHRPIGLEYDSLDRLLAETTTLGTIAYAYDAAGRRIRMTVAGQAPVAYTYDATSRLRTIHQEPLAPVAIEYDAAGRRTLLTLPNQVSTEYQYDPASRLTALIYRNALGPLADLTYTYDAAGNRTAVGGSFARTLLPDPVASATYDAANQQLQFGDKTLTFDPNGNLTTLTDPTGTTTFRWDARDQLTSLTGTGISGAFQYDARRRRVVRLVNGQFTQYLYDGDDIIQELAAGTPVAYLRSLEIDEPFVRNGNEYYLADGLRSILSLTDASGILTTAYSYEPFGRTTSVGVTSANSFQFTGREADPTQLYFYRSRYLRPELGRFISEDPLGFWAGINPYRYVGNNPIRLVDAFGLRGGQRRIAGEDKLIKGLGPKSDPKDIQKAVEAIEKGIKSGEITGKRAKELAGWAKVAKRGFKFGGAIFLVLNELFLDVSEAGETAEELEAFVKRQELDALMRRQELDAREKPLSGSAE